MDVESNGNGKVVYEIQKSNSSAEDIPFEIDSKNGYIFLLERPLPKLQYTLLVEASDQPSNPSERRYSLAVVQIDVVKAGASHSPEFVGSPYEFWVGTQVGIGTSVGQVKVKDLEPKYTVYDLLHSYYEGGQFKSFQALWPLKLQCIVSSIFVKYFLIVLQFPLQLKRELG